MLGKVLLADPRLPVEAVQRRLGSDANEIAVALLVLRQNQQVVVVVALRFGAMVLFLANVELAPKDRMDTLMLCGVEEMDRAIDIAVVCNRNSLLADVGNALHQLFDIAGAVEQGVVGVEMQVGKFRHGLFFYFRSAGARSAASAFPVVRKRGDEIHGVSEPIPTRRQIRPCTMSNRGGFQWTVW